MSIVAPLEDWLKQPELIGVSPDPDNVEHMTPLEALGDFILAISSLAFVGDVYNGTIESPYFLDPLTRGWRSDGGHVIEKVGFTMTVPRDIDPEEPVPVVIFGHAILTERRFVLAVADALASKGFVAISIDFPLHGDRTHCWSEGPLTMPNPTTGELTEILATCEEGYTCAPDGRCVDAAGQGNHQAGWPVIGMPAASGAAFIEMAKIANTNDHFRQSLIDLSALLRSLQSGAWEPVIGAPVDTDNIHYAGMSLGGIIGATFVALTPEIKRIVLNVPGADAVDLFEASPFFSGQVAAFFTREAIDRQSYQGHRAMNVARWFMDSTDPQSFAKRLGERGDDVLIQMALLDIIIPNEFTLKLSELSGIETRDYLARPCLHVHSHRPRVSARGLRRRDLSRRRRSAVRCTLRGSALLLCALAVVLAGAGPARAGGFSLSEQNPVAGGTAGAGTARADDAGAAWYNPAALADGGGLRVGIGAMAALPALRVEAADDSWQTDSESGMSTPPHFNFSYSAGEVAVGMAIGVPFGAGSSWPEEWLGRHEIISSELMVVRVAPFVAWGRGPVRVAAGMQANFGRLQIARGLDFVDAEGDVHIDMSGRSYGIDAAAFYKVTDAVDLGVSYKSRSTLSLSGGADFNAPAAFGLKTADQNATAELNLPDRFAAGGAVRAGRWAVLADLEVSWWKVNEQLVIDFENEATPDATQVNNWQSTLALRAGAEYQLLANMVVRAGGFIDPSPALAANLAPSSPDSTRIGATMGMSRRLGSSFSVDLFYEYMHLLGRSSENVESLAADYGGHAQFLGIGLRIHPVPAEDVW